MFGEARGKKKRSSISNQRTKKTRPKKGACMLRLASVMRSDMLYLNLIKVYETVVSLLLLIQNASPWTIPHIEEKEGVTIFKL